METVAIGKHKTMYLTFSGTPYYGLYKFVECANGYCDNDIGGVCAPFKEVGTPCDKGKSHSKLMLN